MTTTVIPSTESAKSSSYVWECREYTESTSHTNWTNYYVNSTFGGAEELFGTSGLINPVDVNSDYFGVVFRMRPTASTGDTARVDAITMEVYYSLPLVPGTEPSDVGDSMTDVIVTGPVVAAVGHAGLIYTMTDPSSDTWTQRTSGVTESLYSVTWAVDQYIAVGQRGVMLTSSDGITWTAETRRTQQTLYSVEFLGGKIIMTGSSETCLVGTTIANLVFTTSDYTYGVPD